MKDLGANGRFPIALHKKTAPAYTRQSRRFARPRQGTSKGRFNRLLLHAVVATWPDGALSGCVLIVRRGIRVFHAVIHAGGALGH